MTHVARQSEYALRQEQQPSLANLKHLLDAETHYVYGKILDPSRRYTGDVVAVAVYGDAFGKTELVDIMHNARVGTHYGLNVPLAHGQPVRLLVLSDENKNGQFDINEVVGARRLEQKQRQGAQRVVRNIDIELSDAESIGIPEPIPVERTPERKTSIFFPGGAIRSLDDPVFDREVATLGVYDPAAFSEKAPTMFYALEEEIFYKIPVVFVHGMGGTPREFEPLLDRLDRRRFKFFFFYYPSGESLPKLAELFHGIFLSGDAVGQNPLIPTVIVAHSMGGVIVREALNLLPAPTPQSAPLHFISMASPLAGHPSAASGEEHSLIVLPAWRSLNPSSDFITRLYRRPLPPTTTYRLLYAYRNDGIVRFGENSDGVVPLSSQLRPEAQAESSLQRGFDTTHTGILSDERALTFLVDDIEGVRTRYPPDHMAWFFKGGFVVRGMNSHDRIVKYAIETIGQYLRALALGDIAPIDAFQRHFVDVANGRTPPTYELEKAWLEFVENNPNPLNAGR